MLEAKYRFHGHGSLRYAYRNGGIVRSRLLTLKFLSNQNRVHSRVAVVVPKKVIKSAPKRNRIRRRLFEAIRIEWTSIAPHHDLIFNVHSAELLTIPFKEVQAELKHLMNAAHINAPTRVQDNQIPTDTK